MEMNIKGVLKPTQVYKSNKKQNQTLEATDFKKKKNNNSSKKRDGTEREKGGGFRMGNTCIPVTDSC